MLSRMASGWVPRVDHGRRWGMCDALTWMRRAGQPHRARLDADPHARLGGLRHGHKGAWRAPPVPARLIAPAVP